MDRYEIEQRADGRYQIRDYELPRPDGTPRIIGRVSDGFDTATDATNWLKDNRSWKP